MVTAHLSCSSAFSVSLQFAASLSIRDNSASPGLFDGDNQDGGLGMYSMHKNYSYLIGFHCEYLQCVLACLVSNWKRELFRKRVSKMNGSVDPPSIGLVWLCKKRSEAGHEQGMCTKRLERACRPQAEWRARVHDGLCCVVGRRRSCWQ